MAPVLPGVPAEVNIRLQRGLSINGRQHIKQRVVAGAAGIVFDARGRPLVLPRKQERAARYLDWQMAMQGRVRRPKTAAEETAGANQPQAGASAPDAPDSTSGSDPDGMLPSLDALAGIMDKDS
jgi:hypothetical protein